MTKPTPTQLAAAALTAAEQAVITAFQKQQDALSAKDVLKDKEEGLTNALGRALVTGDPDTITAARTSLATVRSSISDIDLSYPHMLAPATAARDAARVAYAKVRMPDAARTVEATATAFEAALTQLVQ